MADSIWDLGNDSTETPKTPDSPGLAHLGKVIVNALGRGVATGAPYIHDVLTNLATPHGQIGSGMHEEGGTGNQVGVAAAAQGRGQETVDVSNAYSKVAGNPQPRNKTEEYASSIAQGVGSALLPGEGIWGLGKAAVGGAVGGFSAQAAHDVFPHSEWAPVVAGLAGGVIGGTGAHMIGEHGSPVARGMQHPEYALLVDHVIPTLEGGGTLENPLTSKKGARGPMQVMPDTARDPGHHIKPSDGSPEGDARVGKELAAALLTKYNGDTSKMLAAYNWGEGNVDHAIATSGENWMTEGRGQRGQPIPQETIDYVHKGMALTYGGSPIHGGSTGGPVGEVFPDVLSSGDIGPAEHPAPELAPDTGEVHDKGNVTDINVARDTQRARSTVEEHQNINDLLDRHLDHARDIQDDINQGDIPLTLREMKENADMANEMRNAMPKDHPLRYKAEELSNMYDDMVKAYHSDPVTDKVPMDSAHEAMTGPIRRNEPANTNGNDVFDENAPLSKEDRARAQELLAGDRAKAKELFAGDREKLKEIDKREGRYSPLRKSIDAFKEMLKNDEGSLKGPSDAEGPDGEKSIPELRKEKKLLLDKLGDALDQGKPIRREAEEAIRKERSRRLAAAMKVRSQKGGEEGFYSELASMKGEMGRPKIESIRHWFNPEEINHLYDIVKNSPALDGYDSINAQKALNKLLGASHGEIPTAREIELLAKAMPSKAKIWKQLLENEEGSLNLPDGALKSAAVNISALPRALKASFDFSAPFRQGMFLVGRKEFWKAMPGMFKSFFSEGHFNEIQDQIFNDPNYHLMNKAGLETTRNNGGLLDREEAFISKFAESIPGVRHSERAYLAFLNKLRADVFNDFVKKGDAIGIDFVQDPHYLKSAARFINSATGRGNLNAVTRDARVLTNVLFSPKLMKSRVDMLNPGFYVGLHPAVRAAAARSGLIYASTVLSVVGLAVAAGATADTDIRSSDFLKIKMGNTRLDVTGGFQPYVRFYAQFLTGQQKAIGKEVVKNIGWSPTQQIWKGHKQGPFKPTTRLDVVYRFLENKESPNMGEVTRLLRGTDAVGKPLGTNANPITDGIAKASHTKVNRAVNEIVDMFTPLIVSDTYQAYQDLGAKGLLTALPNAFGVGVQTYTPKHKPHPAAPMGGETGGF